MTMYNSQTAGGALARRALETDDFKREWESVELVRVTGENLTEYYPYEVTRYKICHVFFEDGNRLASMVLLTEQNTSILPVIYQVELFSALKTEIVQK